MSRRPAGQDSICRVSSASGPAPAVRRATSFKSDRSSSREAAWFAKAGTRRTIPAASLN
ncbi:MAG: hypothetical protein LBU64_04415 [Planctomycetota bacterium]|nr:hypothetical protein [Planctomycetota bacterium]